METGELPRSIALSVAVIDGRRLAGDEGKLARSTSAGSQDRFGERGEEGLTRAVPPQRRGSGGGRQRRERHPVVDGGGSSAGKGRGIDDDLVVVPVRLEEGWSSSLPVASLS
jgi:hypothetical protein